MARYRKALIAAAGLIAQIIAAGAVPAPYDKWAAVVLALLVAAGVYQVPNDHRPAAARPLRDLGQVSAGAIIAVVLIVIILLWAVGVLR